jgi:hypothetical protein
MEAGAFRTDPRDGYEEHFGTFEYSSFKTAG